MPSEATCEARSTHCSVAVVGRRHARRQGTTPRRGDTRRAAASERTTNKKKHVRYAGAPRHHATQGGAPAPAPKPAPKTQALQQGKARDTGGTQAPTAQLGGKGVCARRKEWRQGPNCCRAER